MSLERAARAGLGASGLRDNAGAFQRSFDHLVVLRRRRKLQRHYTGHQRNRHLLPIDLQLLPLTEFFWALGEYNGRAALCSGKFSGRPRGAIQVGIPFGPRGFRLSVFRKPNRRPGDASERNGQVEAEEAVGTESENGRAHRTIQRHETDQLGRQSVGFQTGIGIFRTPGSLVARRLCRGMVLHHKPGIFRRRGHQTTERIADPFPGRAFESRREAALVGVAGRELLVGWRHELERHTEPGDQTNRFAHRRDGFLPDQQTPIHQSQLQQRHIY